MRDQRSRGGPDPPAAVYLFAPDRKVAANLPQSTCRAEGSLQDSMRLWMETQLPLLPGRGKFAEAIRYELSRWDGLTQALRDGRIELDINPVERAIRPVTLGRKNHLFAGSDGGGVRWAVLCSLIETCELNAVELYSYLCDVLQRMVDGHPINRLDELLPWNRQPADVVKM